MEYKREKNKLCSSPLGKTNKTQTRKTTAAALTQQRQWTCNIITIDMAVA